MKKFFEKHTPDGEPPGLYGWKDWSRARRLDLRITGPEELEIERKWLAWAKIDPERFGFFAEKYLARIYRYLVRDLRDPELAAELTQATFVRAFEKRGQFRIRNVTIGAWLYRIATNLRNRHLRDVRRHARYAVPVDTDRIGGPRTAEERLRRHEASELLHAALLELREDYQNVLALHYWEGLSTSRIALVLERKHNTVKGWLQRAREELRVALARRGYEMDETGGHIAAEVDGLNDGRDRDQDRDSDRDGDPDGDRDDERAERESRG
jgi:RNA polymerase sigma factor (sigma-70 family)